MVRCRCSTSGGSLLRVAASGDGTLLADIIARPIAFDHNLKAKPESATVNAAHIFKFSGALPTRPFGVLRELDPFRSKAQPLLFVANANGLFRLPTGFLSLLAEPSCIVAGHDD
jgi:hypothetical protein